MSDSKNKQERSAKEEKFILWFSNVDIEDIDLVGGKNASLGEMISELSSLGVEIPNGFAVTAAAYNYFLDSTGLREKINKILSGLNINNISELKEKGKKIRKLIMDADLPEDLQERIRFAYGQLEEEYNEGVDVAVRSSGTAEDLVNASFAGQQETFLNVSGEEQLVESVKKAISSLFTDRAISYRQDKGFSHENIALSVGVQKMVRSDLASSGVAFSIDTETGFDKVVVINSSYGLGDMVVGGEVVPDEFLVFKPSLESGDEAILEKSLGNKEKMEVYGEKGVKVINVEEKDRKQFSITNEEVEKLASWVKKIEDHFSEKKGHYQPMDVEWAIDGYSGDMFIVQARPETVQSTSEKGVYKNYVLSDEGESIIEGIAVGTKISTGKVRVLKSPDGIDKFKEGEILVTDITDPDWEPIMKIASGVITNKGGRTCFGATTKVLTNKGFLNMSELHRRSNEGEEFCVFSYDYENNNTTWKRVKRTQNNYLKTNKVSVSQTGRVKNNTLEVTPDHRMYTYQGRELIKKPLHKVLRDGEMLCLPDYLPSTSSEYQMDTNLAYLLGVWMTDGNIYFWKGVYGPRRGSVTFTQKEESRKKELVGAVNSCFERVFNKELTAKHKKVIGSTLRGRKIEGESTDFRCYDLSIAEQMQDMFEGIERIATGFSQEEALSFLGGLIDGDGSFYKNRIQIYVSKENVLQAIVVSCLRIGVIPQVTNNREIWNVQILEKMNEILAYSYKIKEESHFKTLGNKLLAAKQVLGDIIDKVNYGGKIKPYVKKNLLLDAEKIKDRVLPLAKGKLKAEIEKIIDSPLRMQRAELVREFGKRDVYDVEVEAEGELEHNYVVFTSQYTPLLVSNSHAAIVSRELRIPAIVGAGDATEKLKDGQMVTLDSSSGKKGKVYEGELDFEVIEKELKDIPETDTKVMVNIGSPHEAFKNHYLPVDGVGLGRLEFIVTSHIQMHPNAALNYDKLRDEPDKHSVAGQMDKLAAGYEDKVIFYREKLREGISQIAAAFWPKEVIIRFSDFKTNEYSSLLGGEMYEPKEANPMLGWRGASRYYHSEFRDAFGLECQAVKEVIDDMGFNNVSLLVPFCRTVDEAHLVVEAMKENGLDKDEREDLNVYIMAEIPSNVLLADDFLNVFDGMSIGTNDLTQLTLGIDRDSARVQKISDERDEAVKGMVQGIIESCKKKNKYVGICGQAPSDFPEFTKFLVDQGIESISLNSDAVVKTLPIIKEAEDNR